jgi:hypothetical protein
MTARPTVPFLSVLNHQRGDLVSIEDGAALMCRPSPPPSERRALACPSPDRPASEGQAVIGDNRQEGSCAGAWSDYRATVGRPMSSCIGKFGEGD